MATSLAALARGLGVPYVFKASYDKANRSSLQSFRAWPDRKGCAFSRP
jgi:3-deoxy-D-manno-octulosonic acid (KDO) 8-phosphate synthase